MSRLRTPKTKAELLLQSIGYAGGALLAVLLMFGSLTAAWRMFERDQEATSATDAAQSQLALLEAENSQVKQDISALSSERGVESALRQRYGVARPGEGVIQIIDETGQGTTTSLSASENIFQRILHTFFLW